MDTKLSIALALSFILIAAGAAWFYFDYQSGGQIWICSGNHCIEANNIQLQNNCVVTETGEGACGTFLIKKK